MALKNAWINGAENWDTQQLVNFANDPLNLIAVEGETNQEKGSKNYYEWKPPNPKTHCAYAKRQVAVKYKYKLKVSEEEKQALMLTLEKC